MATRSLPNPAFGNDPATLLGSLIVEIGELGDLQKATTARIENLDENEDRSTTLIEDAIRDDIVEGQKRTKGILDLKKGVGTLKTYTQDQVDAAQKRYEADVSFQKNVIRMNENIDVSDKIELEMRESLRKIQNYFDTSNPDGIKALGDGIVRGLDNFSQFDKGANQLSRGFSNLFDGMGALGPVVNAFKTGMNKAVAGFDVVAGLTRSIIGGFRSAASFTKNLFTGEIFDKKPVNQVAQDLAKGDAVIVDDAGGGTEGRSGTENSPMFVEFTDSALEALRNVMSGGNKERLEEKDFRRKSLKNIREQRAYRRGTPRAFLYLGGIILVLAVLLNTIKSFLTDTGSFFQNVDNTVILGSLAGALGFSGALTSDLSDEDIERIRKAQTSRPGAGTSKGSARKAGSFRGLNTGFSFTALPEDLRPLARSPFKVSGTGMLPNFANRASSFVFSGPTALANSMNRGAQKTVTSSIVDANGKLTTYGKSLTPMERLRLGGIGLLRTLPAALIVTDTVLTAKDFNLANQVLDDVYNSGYELRLGDSGEFRPMEKSEYDFLKAQLKARLAGETVGGAAAIGAGLATGTILAAAFTPTPDVGVAAASGGPFAFLTGSGYYVLKAGGIMLASGLAAYGTDVLVSDAAENVIGGIFIDEQGNNRFNLDDLENIQYLEPTDSAGQIEGTVAEIQSYDATAVGGVAPGVIVSADDNSSNTSFIDQRPPADDEGLKESEKERSSYFNRSE